MKRMHRETRAGTWKMRWIKSMNYIRICLQKVILKYMGFTCFLQKNCPDIYHSWQDTWEGFLARFTTDATQNVPYLYVRIILISKHQNKKLYELLLLNYCFWINIKILILLIWFMLVFYFLFLTCYLSRLIVRVPIAIYKGHQGLKF